VHNFIKQTSGTRGLFFDKNLKMTIVNLTKETIESLLILVHLLAQLKKESQPAIQSGRLRFYDNKRKKIFFKI
jgi:hypothetical protein